MFLVLRTKSELIILRLRIDEGINFTKNVTMPPRVTSSDWSLDLNTGLSWAWVIPTFCPPSFTCVLLVVSKLLFLVPSNITNRSGALKENKQTHFTFNIIPYVRKTLLCHIKYKPTASSRHYNESIKNKTKYFRLQLFDSNYNALED